MMGSEELKIIRDGLDRMADRIESLSGDLTSHTGQIHNLEIAVRSVLFRTKRHDKILKYAQALGFVAAGLLVGAGLVELSKVISLILH